MAYKDIVAQILGVKQWVYCLEQIEKLGIMLARLKKTLSILAKTSVYSHKYYRIFLVDKKQESNLYVFLCCYIFI